MNYNCFQFRALGRPLENAAAARADGSRLAKDTDPSLRSQANGAEESFFA